MYGDHPRRILVQRQAQRVVRPSLEHRPPILISEVHCSPPSAPTSTQKSTPLTGIRVRLDPLLLVHYPIDLRGVQSQDVGQHAACERLACVLESGKLGKRSCWESEGSSQASDPDHPVRARVWKEEEGPRGPARAPQTRLLSRLLFCSGQPLQLLANERECTYAESLILYNPFRRPKKIKCASSHTSERASSLS